MLRETRRQRATVWPSQASPKAKCRVGRLILWQETKYVTQPRVLFTLWLLSNVAQIFREILPHEFYRGHCEGGSLFLTKWNGQASVPIASPSTIHAHHSFSPPILNGLWISLIDRLASESPGGLVKTQHAEPSPRRLRAEPKSCTWYWCCSVRDISEESGRAGTDVLLWPGDIQLMSPVFFLCVHPVVRDCVASLTPHILGLLWMLSSDSHVQALHPFLDPSPCCSLSSGFLSSFSRKHSFFPCFYKGLWVSFFCFWSYYLFWDRITRRLNNGFWRFA